MLSGWWWIDSRNNGIWFPVAPPSMPEIWQICSYSMSFDYMDLR